LSNIPHANGDRKMDFTIREVNSDDIAALFELYRNTHPDRNLVKEDWERDWKWMFSEVPLGANIWVAVHENRIVGQYPIVKSNMKILDNICISAQNVDLMTDPDYRGKGIFKRLEKVAIEELAKSDITFTFGFPNKASKAGHIKSGWTEISKMSILVKPLLIRGLISHLISMDYSAKNSIAISGIESFDEDISVLTNNFSKGIDLIGIRDAAFLNWRYPSNRGYLKYLCSQGERKTGYYVMKISKFKGFKIGILFDLQFENVAVLRAIIEHLVKTCSKNHAVMAVFPSICDEGISGEFSRSGFFRWPSSGPPLFGMVQGDTTSLLSSQIKSLFFKILDT
jgi:GNAT superfamily N-acetyltransferase